MENTTRLDEKVSSNTSFRPMNEVFIFMSLYVLLSLLTITGNTFVIVAFKKIRIRAAINMFFVSLAVSDLMVGAVSIPLWIYHLSCPSFKRCGLPSAHVGIFYRAFDVFSAIASTSNLIAISIERYFAICWPVQHRASSYKRYYKMLFITWIYSVLVTSIYSVDFSPTWEQYRGLLVFVAGFALPLIVLIGMYSSIYVGVKNMNAHWRRAKAMTSILAKRVQQERRTAPTMVIVTALFLACWLPFFVVSLLWIFQSSSLLGGGRGKGFMRLMDFIKWMHYSNSAVNPLVYAYRSDEMRRILIKLPERAFGMELERRRAIRPENRNNWH
ncbi:dopamine receptor 3-like [Stylophora pistillata]|nr:dopamine receptor 3-like [Stylophora pistillata]